ncbi:MAG: class 1 fructose-bisphosphatase, partial [Bacteroidetes bacterium]|nr:class 1 fructose-bisphosphatase [Bacteroidota bacterium]
GTLDDLLQVGRKQVVAGYVIYGSSTVMVYSAGFGVHVFTLDPTIGEFRLCHRDIKTPAVGKYYSVNESYYHRWTDGYRGVVQAFKGDGSAGHRKNA